MTNEEKLADAKEALIDLLEYYRDEYHKSDLGHNEYIEQVKQAKTLKELEPIERMVDDWLDY